MNASMIETTVKFIDGSRFRVVAIHQQNLAWDSNALFPSATCMFDTIMTQFKIFKAEPF